MSSLYENSIRSLLIATLTLTISCSANPSESDRIEVRKKVGQLFLLAFSGNNQDVVLPFIKDRGIGGLYLSNENLGRPEEAARLLNSLQAASLTGISKLPLLTAADQEGAWGVMVPYSSTGPGNMALGASHPGNTKKMYSVFSGELSAVGIFCDLSPVADVNSNPLNPIIGTRSFGENADEVAVRVKVAIEGLHQNGVIATAKHFPGHGNTATDSHSGIPQVTRTLEEIESIDLSPFVSAIEAGVDIIMTAHIIYDALDRNNPATLSHKILNNYLREKLGFKGVIITDSFNMHAIQKNYDPSEAAIAAILAGADMIMLAEERYGEDVGDYIKSQTEMLDQVEKAVMEGRIPMERINEAYQRITELKERYKLKDKIPVDPDLAKEIVGHQDNKLVELQCAEAALTVVYDKKGVVPLTEKSEIAVVKLSKEEVEEIIKIAQGIGPNYATAYMDFVKAMMNEGFGVNEYTFDDQAIPEDNVIIAVSENYPLPGKSLDIPEQHKRLSMLRQEYPDAVIINVALRDPYDAYLVEADADAYVTAIGSNVSNIKAIVNLLAGKAEATGELPVTPIGK